MRSKRKKSGIAGSFRKIAASALAAAMLCGLCLPIAGCTEGEKEVVVWTADNLTKVLRDQDYSDRYNEASFTYEMAKNEYESAQIIISAKDKINDYTLTTSELTNADGDKITVDQLSVYNQHYIELTKNSGPTNAPLGYYPDGMIPFDSAEKAGENVIEKGRNQGIWVTVRTTEETEAGVYTGAFDLTVDGTVYEIPVQVKVWNFAIPTESSTKTAFYTFREYLGPGELDNSPEMYEAYSDFMMDYRCSVTNLPVLEYDSANPEKTENEYVEAAKKYAADPRCSGYNMLLYPTQEIVSTVDGSGTWFRISADFERIESLLRKLVEASTPELNLVEKLYVYYIDEPHGSVDRMQDVKVFNEKLIDLFIEVANDYEQRGLLDDYGLTWEDIAGIEYVVTAPPLPELAGVRTFCVGVSEYATESERNAIRAARENSYAGKNNELKEREVNFGTSWMYTANLPYAPQPNYHIDANLTTARAMSWMQKDYGATGLLYWATAVYVEINDSEATARPRDPYNSTQVNYVAQGDGFLLYPGKKYGLKHPIASIRLEAIRDGLEDYEYLTLLSDLAESAAEKYDAPFDIDKITRSLYDSIYTGVVAYTDGVNHIAAARREVAELIELLASPSNALVMVDGIDATSETATVSVYAAPGSTLSVDGEEVSGQTIGDNAGVKFICTVPLSEQENYFDAEITTNGVTSSIRKYVSNRVSMGASFESDDELGNWIVSKGLGTPADGYDADHIDLEIVSDPQYVTEGESALKMTIGAYRADETSSGYNTTYRPSLRVGLEDLFGEYTLSQIDTLTFQVYNASGKTVEMRIQYLSEAGAPYVVMTVSLEEGLNTVSIAKIWQTDWANLDKASSIRFDFDRIDTLGETDVLYFDNFIYSYR